MNTGKISAISLLFTSFLLLMQFFASLEAKVESSQENTDIPELLRKLGQKASDFKTLETDFVQEKNLAVFQNKIVMKGRIYLQKPHRIAWHVDKPVKYSVLITDKVIRQWDEDTNQVQELPLSKNPVFKVVLGQLTTWFSGNYISLLDDYSLLVKKQNPFIFEFIPKETNFAKKIIRSITVTFRDDERYLKQIKILEISGDSTIITFENTVLNPPLEDHLFQVGRRGR
jgi:outer membrane lipoprotein-sorting protein